MITGEQHLVGKAPGKAQASKAGRAAGTQSQEVPGHLRHQGIQQDERPTHTELVGAFQVLRGITQIAKLDLEPYIFIPHAATQEQSRGDSGGTVGG